MICRKNSAVWLLLWWNLSELGRSQSPSLALLSSFQLRPQTFLGPEESELVLQTMGQVSEHWVGRGLCPRHWGGRIVTTLWLLSPRWDGWHQALVEETKKPALRRQCHAPGPSGPQPGLGSPDCMPSALPGSSGHGAQNLASGLATRALGAGRPRPAWACSFPLAPNLLLSCPWSEPPVGAGLSVCPSDQPFLQPGWAELPGMAGTVSMEAGIRSVATVGLRRVQQGRQGAAGPPSPG